MGEITQPLKLIAKKTFSGRSGKNVSKVSISKEEIKKAPQKKVLIGF